MFERTPARLWWTSLLAALVLAGCYEDNEVEPEPDAAPPIVDECTGSESRNCFVEGNCTGTQTCQGGRFGECTPPTETCDGQDNDCDGTADEDFPTLGDDCQGGQGKCIDQGRVVCSADGSGVECDARPGDATDEVCDAIDNDCDGMVDEDIAAGIACETGLPGACGAGQTACVDGDTVCEPTVEASDEVCDGIDNDCNGAVDDAEVGGPLVESCYEGPAGTEDVGACAAGVRTCVDGMFGACEGSVTPTSESCDEVDNDCDGEVDNVGDGECVCVPGAVEDCYSGPDGTAGVGVCRAGRRTCNAEGTAFSACEGERVPGVELCDGADNDCNGELDDVAGLGEACGEGQGACAAEGVRVCDLESGQIVCDAQAGLPADEVCDGVDNDCDGQIDDVDGAGEPCAVGEGACIGRGVLRCDPDAGQLTCSAVEGQPGAELCNNLDDDCNGVIDDVPGLGMDCSIGVGACRSTAVTVCDVAAGAVVCPATEQDPAPAEYCGNGIDDDCDGETDDADCVTPCGFDDDCRVGESCVEGVCVADVCVTDDDCDPGLTCVEGTCREPVATGCGDARPVGFGRHDAIAEGDSAFGLASCTFPPNSTDGPEVVFAFTPDVAGDVCVSTAGSAFDTVLTVRRDPCEEAGSEIACNDDVGDGFDLSSRVGFAAMAGMTYYIVVDTFEGESGAVVLDIAAGPCAPAPGDEICDNTQDDDGDGATDCDDLDCAADPVCQDPDLCVDAMMIGLGRTEGMVEGPSRTTLASCTRPADAAAGPEMVYAFTAEAAGTLCIDTRGSQIDTILTVRQAPCGAGDEVACNDDAADTLDSELELEAMAGMTYYLVVDTFAGEAGGFVLNINEGACEAGPVDEICDNGVDDDGDGAVDCEDLGCAFDPACPILGDEICDNNLDDDDDGDVDCDDEDCFLDPNCLIGPEEICDNGQDDDGDDAIDCADADCAFDPACFEPVTCDDATEIGFGTFEGTLEGPSSTDLASCTFFPNDAGGPEAFFAFTSAAGGQVCVDTRGSEPDTILTVRVDPCEDPASEIACNDDIDFIGGFATSEVDFVAEAGTTYYIVVDTFERDSGAFVLNVSEGPCGDIGEDEICDDGVDNDGDEAIDCEDADCGGDPACASVCVPDDFEPNEDIDSATPIMAGSYADLSICGDDVDFYAIEICAGGTLTLDVLFTHAGGDIDVLFGDADDIITSSESGSDNEQIVFLNDGPTATFYAQVFGFDGAENSYSLEVAIDGCDGP
ncbi:MAG: hypothetical protein H6701_16855, partial [Myxococcales bacterium]|nr:hypothetical protein [Myxococcales bacterium]